MGIWFPEMMEYLGTDSLGMFDVLGFILLIDQNLYYMK